MKEVYERILSDPQWLEWMGRIDEHARVATREEYLCDHGQGHAVAVSERAMDFMRQVGEGEEDVWLAGVAGLLHDVGNAVGRDNHEKESVRMLSEGGFGFLKKLGVTDERSIERLLHAIGGHSDAHDILDMVDAALVLADKTDMRKSRMLVSEEDAHKFFADLDASGQEYNKWVKLFVLNLYKVEDVDVRVESEGLIVKYDVDEGFELEFFESWPKAVRVPWQVADFTERYFQLIVDGEEVPRDKYKHLL